jgi:2-phosphoglycolate phosphatase
LRESALSTANLTAPLKQPKALLFDLDGTLMDTAPDFFPTVNTLRKEHNLPPLADEVIRMQVSNGGRALTRLGLGMQPVAGNSVGDEIFESKRQRLLDLYVEHIAEKSDLFPGMIELLERCKQYSLPWGIVTNKPRLYTEILLARLADQLPILAHCAVVVCPDDVKRTKPFPDPLFLAAETLNISAQDCWYFGDHIRDIEAGNSASMFTIATLYGYIEADDNPTNWQADIMVDSVAEITQLLTASFAKKNHR